MPCSLGLKSTDEVTLSGPMYHHAQSKKSMVNHHLSADFKLCKTESCIRPDVLTKGISCLAGCSLMHILLLEFRFLLLSWLSSFFSFSPPLHLFRMNLLRQVSRVWKTDGLNSCSYKLLSVEYNPLYTNITVDFGMPVKTS